MTWQLNERTAQLVETLTLAADTLRIDVQDVVGVIRCEQLSDEQRVTLADQLAEAANRHLWQAHKLSKLAEKVRPLGWNPPGAPQ